MSSLKKEINTNQKNHFYMAYFGNKRNEIYDIYNKINFENIDTVIEPYCGSQCISYYIWTHQPNLKFILNDNNKFLKEMYEILKDDEKSIEFERKINEELFDKIQEKEEYNKIIKEDNVMSWFIKNKFYAIRPGLFNLGKIKKINLSIIPIINFYKNANIEFNTLDGIFIYEKYKNDKNNLIILDPPYLASCNEYYLNPSTNIYEYLYNNDIKNENAKIYLILEDNWVIHMLFKEYIIFFYNKKYESKKKKTVHLLITN